MMFLALNQFYYWRCKSNKGTKQRRLGFE